MNGIGEESFHNEVALIWHRIILEMMRGERGLIFAMDVVVSGPLGRECGSVVIRKSLVF